MKVYLSGAMEVYAGTNKASIWRKEIEKYFDNFCDDVTVINPSKYYQYETDIHTNEFEVFRYDLRLTSNSDIVIVNLENIRKSVGSIIELYEAYKNNIPVIGFTEENINVSELPNHIHPWIYTICDRIIIGDNSMFEACDYVKAYYSDLYN